MSKGSNGLTATAHFESPHSRISTTAASTLRAEATIRPFSRVFAPARSSSARRTALRNCSSWTFERVRSTGAIAPAAVRENDSARASETWNGGLVGKVTKVVDDDQIEFEISDGVRVRQMRQMISGVRAKGEPAKGDAKDEASAS